MRQILSLLYSTPSNGFPSQESKAKSLPWTIRSIIGPWLKKKKKIPSSPHPCLTVTFHTNQYRNKEFTVILQADMREQARRLWTQQRGFLPRTWPYFLWTCPYKRRVPDPTDCFWKQTKKPIKPSFKFCNTCMYAINSYLKYPFISKVKWTADFNL